MPGLKLETTQEILYYITQIIKFIENKPNIYTNIYSTLPISTPNNLYLENLFKKHHTLSYFNDWKQKGCLSNDKAFTILYKILLALRKAFTGMYLSEKGVYPIPISQIQDYELYKNYFGKIKQQISNLS